MSHICRIFFVLFSCYTPIYAQLQDSLPDVQIIEQRFKDSIVDVRENFTAGQELQVFSQHQMMLYARQSLADFLSEQSPVFVKSYGVNGMSTLTFRGASAAQSAVLWNGVPITNPAVGLADVSLLTTGLFDRIAIQYGGSAALLGSGNVGGALLLDEKKADFTPQKHLSLGLGLGSFGRKNLAFRSGFQNQRWNLNISSFYQNQINDFPYSNDIGEEVNMTNSRLEAGGILLNADLRLGKMPLTLRKDHRLSFKIWWQKYNRQIPPALFESQSLKLQQDQSLRSLIHWQKTSGSHHLYVKSSINLESLHYDDEALPLNNKNLVVSYYQEAGWRWQLHSGVPNGSFLNKGIHRLLIFTPWQFTQATGSQIINRKQQHKPAIAGSLQFQSANAALQANIALRQEWVNSVAAPLLPGAGISYDWFVPMANKSEVTIRLRGNLQRTFRTPNLNELYYFPGGNPDLKPEQGWTSDAGYRIQYSKGKHVNSNWSVVHELSVFNRQIHDWIYWLGGSIWTPHNIAEVHSRGVETNNQLAWRLTKNWVADLSVKTAYVLATTVQSQLPNDGSIGKQIPYTPRYKGQGNFGIRFRRFSANYNHTYTGYRFSTIDESHYLLPYQTGSIQLMYVWQKGDYLVRVIGQLQNIWDEDYQIVNARPMPGRHYLLNLQLSWNQ